jgi:hypothetical protein
VVVAIVDRRIAKVECKQCGARHRFRPSDGETTAARAGRASGVRTTPGRAAKAKARKAAIVEADPSRPARQYRPSDCYEQGDRLVHPSFGEGIVQAVSGPKKVLVLFAAGEKTLVQARGSAS